MDETLRKVREVAASARVTPRCVYEWIRTGRLEALRIGGRIRVSNEAFRKMIRPAREGKVG